MIVVFISVSVNPSTVVDFTCMLLTTINIYLPNQQVLLRNYVVLVFPQHSVTVKSKKKHKVVSSTLHRVLVEI